MTTNTRLQPLTRLLSLASVVAVAASPSAGTMIEVSPGELFQSCQCALVGEVRRVHSQWNSDRNMIYTYATIAPTQWLKGQDQPSELVVRIEGGTVGPITCHVSDQPEFKVHESVLVFLEPEPSEPELWTVSGLFQGKFTISGGRVAENGLLLRDFVRRIEEGLDAEVQGPPGPEEEERLVGRYWYNGQKWPESAMPVPFYMNANGLDDCIFDEFQAVLRAAHAWEQVPGAFFDFCYEGTTATNVRVEDGVNVVSWAPLAAPLVGYARWWDNNGVIYEADLTLNNNESWYAFPGDFCRAEKYDVESVATHEFGHWMSLGHSGVAGATMKSGIPTGSTYQRYLAADDMNGQRRAYPHPDGVPKPQPGCWPWAPPDPLVMAFSPNGAADLDRDGVDEIIVGVGGSSTGVWSINGDATANRDNGLATGNIADSAPATADLDGDGWLEAVVGSTDNKVYALNHDGTALPGWPVGAGGEVHSSPAIGDIDGDGQLEIVVGSDAFAVWAWNVNGTLVDDGFLPSDWPQMVGGLVRSSPALGDLDSNGSLDIVVGCDDGNVYAWDYTGTALPGWPVATGGMVLSSPALADIDADGRLEVIVGSFDGKVYAWNHDGTPVDRDGLAPWDWPQTTGDAVEGSPAVADLDADGRLDVVIGSRDAKVYAWDYTGTDLPGWPVTAPTQVTLSPLIGDVDGDGALEVVAVAGTDIHAFNANGSSLGWNIDDMVETASTPVLGDFDGNGELEIAYAGGGVMGTGVRCRDLGSPYDPALLPWPMFGHDHYHTSLDGFQPPPVPALPYFDPFDPDLGDHGWGTDNVGGSPPGLNTFIFVSPPYSFEIVGSSVPGEYAWAQSKNIGLDLSQPYSVSFYFAYLNFYQTRFFEFGHVRLMLDSLGTPLFYDVDGNENYVPVGPAVGSYLAPPSSWNFVEISVDPSANQYSIQVGGFPVGAAPYSGSMVPSPALHMEDGPDAGSWLEAAYDDITVDGVMAPVCLLPGDYDCSATVDLVDFAAFAECLSGPGFSPTPTPPISTNDCLANFDSEVDVDVDLADYAAFQIGFWPEN